MHYYISDERVVMLMMIPRVDCYRNKLKQQQLLRILNYKYLGLRLMLHQINSHLVELETARC